MLSSKALIINLNSLKYMSKIYDIVTHPNPSLREKSMEIKEQDINTPEFLQLCDDMAVTMIKKDGVGLAAPQICKNIRLIVVNTKSGPKAMINPKITKKSWAKEYGEEGCLSVPNTFAEVNRHKKINFTYIDLNGKNVKDTAKNMKARVIQHELDHLDGILFIDKAKNLSKN